MELQSFPILIRNKDVADNSKMYLEQEYVTSKKLADEDKKLADEDKKLADEDKKLADEDKLKKEDEEEEEEEEE
ncbi:MAG: hypothetical protein H0U27_06885, partial [Nitrosopumilus sp.]|nr:hypothetical protein [Nitrosopumilus sp.]